MDDKFLKCRYCDFKAPKYRKLKDGRIKSGFNIINAHIETDHPEDYEQLLEWWDKHRDGDWIDGE